MDLTCKENGGKYFEGIFYTSGEAMVLVDAEGRIKEINQAFTTLLGYELPDVKSSYFNDIVHNTTRAQKTSGYIKIYHFHRALHSPIEMELIDSKNHPVAVKFRSALIKDSNGKVIEAIGIMQDLQAKKEKITLEQRVRESRETLYNILANSGDGIMVCDTNGRITLANEALLKMVGYRENELIGKHLLEIAPTEGRFTTVTGEEVTISSEYLKCAADKALELFEKGKAEYEVFLVRKDGLLVPVETTLSLLKDHHGERRGSIAICRDITEKIKAERAIKDAKEFLENIFETSLDGLMVTDSAGFITMVNKSLCTMLDYPREAFIGKRPKDFFPNTREYKEKNEELLTTLVEKGAVTDFKTALMKKNGSLVAVEINTALLKDPLGAIKGSVASIRDITQRKELELRLFHAEKLKSLGELAGGVAHDFNNILAAILGRTQLLKMILQLPPGVKQQKTSKCELKKGLDIIEQAAKDGAETVRRIQEFARYRDEHQHCDSIDIHEVIEHALEFTRVRWKDESEVRGITFEIKKDFSPLPPVRGVASELREVFTNLINNAIDAMPQGGTIKIATSQEDSIITIKVEDNGVGIPPAARDSIFDPFFTTKGPQSSGLGLSVSYGIINRHRGTITVNSIQGKGTTFIISLPISQDTVKEKRLPPSPRTQRKARILVIDDEETVRNLLSEILLQAGHEVVTTPNGTQGIENFEKEAFDLVFTDLGMPGMSGWEVAKKIKAMNSSVPVIMLTGWELTLTEEERHNQWVDSTLKKPFEMHHLLSLVNKVMRQKEQQVRA